MSPDSQEKGLHSLIGKEAESLKRVGDLLKSHKERMTIEILIQRG